MLEGELSEALRVSPGHVFCTVPKWALTQQLFPNWWKVNRAADLPRRSVGRLGLSIDHIYICCRQLRRCLRRRGRAWALWFTWWVSTQGERRRPGPAHEPPNSTLLLTPPLFRDPVLQISRPTYLRDVGRPCRITGHPIEVGACGWVHAGRAGDVAEVSHVPPGSAGPALSRGG